MHQYLGSTVLQSKTADLWAADIPVGAFCHGVCVLARMIDPAAGRCVLDGRRTTSLTKSMERTALLATTRRLGRCCWTYPVYVQDEVTAALGAQGTFLVGPRGLWRDTGATTGSDFVIDDGRYVSAQWPGGAWTFAATVTRLVSG